MKRLLRSLRANPKRDVGDELAFHIDMRAAEFRAAGMSDEDARRAAIAAFGDVGAMKDQLTTVRQADVEERRRQDRLQELRSDIGFALRTFRKNPGFTGAALATLALGIGATIAVFTVLNGVLLRPLPYHEPSRIAMIWMSSDKPGGGKQLPVSTGFYLHALETSRSFESMAAFRAWPYTITSNGDAEQIRGARVTPSLFSVLGARPLLGRVFNDGDAEPGANKVALLSHSLWQRRFGGDSSILDKPLQLGSATFTVIGVMPEGFAFPRGAELPAGLQFALRTELWTPLTFSATDRTAYGTLNMAGIGRLKNGVTIAQARADLTGNLQALLDRLNARALALSFQTVSMQDQAGQPVRKGLWLLMGAVALVLFIACANVTNLLVARTSARRRELSMRAALGAGRSRIARQLITENVLMAVLGTAVGVVLSIWVTRAMLAMVPGSMPRTDDVQIDWRVTGGALAIAILAGSAFGLISTLQIRLGDLAATLREAGSRTAGGPRSLGRQALVTVEVALSVVLVIGAALLMASFSRLQQVDAGIDSRNVLTSNVGLPIAAGFDPARDGPGWASFFAQVQDRLAKVPGVRAVGFTSAIPLAKTTESGAYAVIGRPTPKSGEAPSADYAVISGEYFRAAGIELLKGRMFDGRDQASTTPVVIVNRQFAKTVFADSVAIGRQIVTYFDWTGATRTIVGIVEDTRQAGLDAPVRPMVYTPQSQMPYPGLRMLVRADGDPFAALPALKREIKATNSQAVVAEVEPLADIEHASLARRRFSMTVLMIFAGLASVLATVGLYGVIALSVGQRYREIGVRMALGAAPRDVVRQILGEGMRLATIGVVIGVVGAGAASRLIASMLFGVSALNATLYVAVVVGILAVSAVATLLPARRATRVDPLLALRSD